MNILLFSYHTCVRVDFVLLPIDFLHSGAYNFTFNPFSPDAGSKIVFLVDVFDPFAMAAFFGVVIRGRCCWFAEQCVEPAINTYASENHAKWGQLNDDIITRAGKLTWKWIVPKECMTLPLPWRQVDYHSEWLHGERGRCQVKGAVWGLTRVWRPCRSCFAISFASARFPKQ